MPPLMSTTAAADEIGVSVPTIRKWIASGQLRAFRVGARNYRVSLEDVRNQITPVQVEHALPPEEAA